MRLIRMIIIIGLIILLWFIPIDLERERQIADSGPRMIMLYVLEHTWLKIGFTLLLILALRSLYKQR